MAAAKPGKLRLVKQNNNDQFPQKMRDAIDAATRGMNKWHIELSIRTEAPSEFDKPGKIRFKHNFPDGMRELIKQNLGVDDWSLQMKLVDGDGDGDDASGDDDGNAPGVDLRKSRKKKANPGIGKSAKPAVKAVVGKSSRKAGGAN